MKECEIILNNTDMQRTLARLASEISERRGNDPSLALVGLQRRGVDLAERLRLLLEKQLACSIPLGKLDINLYRDDWTTLDIKPTINDTQIPFQIENSSIILVDDVLFSGRTVRAALEAILDYGRPTRVELLVLVDRGNRELPIHADYVGKKISTSPNSHVNVLVTERDNEDKVCLVQAEHKA